MSSNGGKYRWELTIECDYHAADKKRVVRRVFSGKDPDDVTGQAFEWARSDEGEGADTVRITQYLPVGKPDPAGGGVLS